jgi:hypothetical protein
MGKPASYNQVSFCSYNCLKQFWLKVNEYPTDDVGTDIAGFYPRVTWLWHNAILNAAAQTNPNSARQLMSNANNAIRLHTPRFVAFNCNGPDGKPLWMYTNFLNKAKLTLARNLERCGRTQDAAKVFEEMRMYDKARELRERDRHIIVKKTDVSINLNALLQQVKDGGIVAIFRCPHCGGKLKISDKTTMNSLRTCEHCGSEIESMDLAEFLKAALN